ncbi:MAG: hypothetical protein LBB81_10210 [Treponema sp.]|nr:hypothetical protein [Treponema sp.]
MKKLFIGIILIFFAVAAFSDDTGTYIQIYNTALTNIEQYDLLKLFVEEAMPGMEDFYIYALRRLIANYSNIREAPQFEAADGQALLLSREVAKGSNTAVAADLWVIAEKFYNEYTRGEAMIALGKLKAGEYRPKIILFLNELNAHRTEDRLYGERLANGAIIALEMYGEPSCYIPVYFASKGWYSDPVKIQAQKSMDAISSEPMPFMLEILRNPSFTVTQRYEVLQHVVTGNFSSTQKSDMAAAALAEAWRIFPSNSGDRMILSQIRKLSLSTIRENGLNDKSAYTSIERCYYNAIDINEKDDTINALAALATDEAVRILSVALMEMNSKLNSGRLTQEDQQVTRLLINAIGRSGNRNGRSALLGVINSNWVNSIKNLARDALMKLV